MAAAANNGAQVQPYLGIRAQVERYITLNDYEPKAAAVQAVRQDLHDPIFRTRQVYTYARNTMSKELGGESTDLLFPMTPFSVKELIIASHNAKAEAKDGNRNDGDYIRMKNLIGGLIFDVFTLAARVIRIFFRCAPLLLVIALFIPAVSPLHGTHTLLARVTQITLYVGCALTLLSLLVSAYQDATYGPKMAPGQKYNIVLEDLKRMAYEVEDLLISAIVVPVIAAVNFIAPRAISTDWLRDHYFSRIDDIRRKNATFNAARDAYNREKEQNNIIWHQGLPADGEAFPPAQAPAAGQPQGRRLGDADPVEGQPQQPQ